MKSCYRWRNPPLGFGPTFPTVFMAHHTFKRCHFRLGRRISAEFPAANSIWQPGGGSEQPPVILFLHMASSVKRSLRIPARGRRSTCDWPVCCHRSCQPPTLLIKVRTSQKAPSPPLVEFSLAEPAEKIREDNKINHLKHLHT